jgi:stringent starvation protein B
MFDTKDATSTRPYLIRALYEWCTDNGFTPYVAVLVDDTVRVPVEHVKNGEIVLNISFDATSALKISNDAIEFKARFTGTSRDIMVPISRVIAIYARENGQGMTFPMAVPVSPGGVAPVQDGKVVQLAAVSMPPPGTHSPHETNAAAGAVSSHDEPEVPTPPSSPKGQRPVLKRVK